MKVHLFLLLGVLAAIALIGSALGINVREEPRGSSYIARDLPAPAPDQVRMPQGTNMCTAIYTGTLSSRFLISRPGGISDFHDYHLVNFDQRLISQSADSIEIEITSHAFLDTRAPYPVDAAALSGDVQGYLNPSAGIQSNDPEIAAKAQEVVGGLTTQAQAVDAVLAWVRANIAYDYTFSLPNDASAVFRNRSGVCAGFSNLATALLRAMHIPARYQSGCVAQYGGWQTGIEGGRHAWIEAYYPDAGWVASDPQVSENYLDTSHMVSGFDQCGVSGTVISRTGGTGISPPLYSGETVYSNSIWSSLNAAQVPAWDRHPLRITPSSYSLMLAIASPVRPVSFQVQNTSCGSDGSWQIKSGSAWITPIVATGTASGNATLTVDGTGMTNGAYAGSITAYGSADTWAWHYAISRTLPLNLWLVDQVYPSYLPLIRK